MLRVSSAVLAEPPGMKLEKLQGCITDRAHSAHRAAASEWRGRAQEPVWSRHCGA